MTLTARIPNPAIHVPGAFQALQDLSKTAEHPGVPAQTHLLVLLRASQINGCSVCAIQHARELKNGGAHEDLVFAVAAWHDAPYFSEAERAALALTEAVTRLSERADPVPDAVWNEAAQHFEEGALGALLISISAINVWNRLNVSTRQVGGGSW